MWNEITHPFPNFKLRFIHASKQGLRPKWVIQSYRNWYQDWGHCGVTRAKLEGCGELPRSLVTPQWPKSRYQFLFYHDASKRIKSIHIQVCANRKSLIKLLQISHFGKHGHRPLSQQLARLRLGYHCDLTVMSVALNLDNMPHWKTSKSNKMFV